MHYTHGLVSHPRSKISVNLIARKLRFEGPSALRTPAAGYEKECKEWALRMDW